MTTCATIGSIQTNGTIEVIHIQVNGRDVGVGNTLITHYSTQELVDQLIAIGNVGILFEKPSINSVHLFPRGKPRVPVRHNYSTSFRETRNFATQDEWFEYFDECDYGYFFDGSEWTFYKNIVVD